MNGQAAPRWQAHCEALYRQHATREVFALRYIEGMSTQEVAGTLDLSNGSVKRHLFRAVKYLRGAPGELGSEGGHR